MIGFNVKKVAELSGVSVRTLHHYDNIGLFNPSNRSEKGYRLYDDKDLLRLQQILFFKEMDFPLKEIKKILDDPGFDKVKALEGHKQALINRKQRINTLLTTIEKTIDNLKNGKMMKHEELYEGMPGQYRDEAIEKWGRKVEDMETHLLKKDKAGFNKLKDEFDNCWRKLASLKDRDPQSRDVQQEIESHYNYIREFWGTSDLKDPQAEAYIGLSEMYKSDNRFTQIDGKETDGFGEFIEIAMKYFAENHLK